MAEVRSSNLREPIAGAKNALVAQLGEHQAEDLGVPGSSPGQGIFFFSLFLFMMIK